MQEHFKTHEVDVLVGSLAQPPCSPDAYVHSYLANVLPSPSNNVSRYCGANIYSDKFIVSLITELETKQVMHSNAQQNRRLNIVNELNLDFHSAIIYACQTGYISVHILGSTVHQLVTGKDGGQERSNIDFIADFCMILVSSY